MQNSAAAAVTGQNSPLPGAAAPRAPRDGASPAAQGERSSPEQPGAAGGGARRLRPRSPSRESSLECGRTARSGPGLPRARDSARQESLALGAHDAGALTAYVDTRTQRSANLKRGAGPESKVVEEGVSLLCARAAAAAEGGSRGSHAGALVSLQTTTQPQRPSPAASPAPPLEAPNGGTAPAGAAPNESWAERGAAAATVTHETSPEASVDAQDAAGDHQLKSDHVLDAATASIRCAPATGQEPPGASASVSAVAAESLVNGTVAPQAVAGTDARAPAASASGKGAGGRAARADRMPTELLRLLEARVSGGPQAARRQVTRPVLLNPAPTEPQLGSSSSRGGGRGCRGVGIRGRGRPRGSARGGPACAGGLGATSKRKLGSLAEVRGNTSTAT